MNVTKLFRGLGVAMLAGTLGAAALVAPATADSQMKSPKTIYKIASSSDDFETLTAAVKAAGLKKALSGKDDLTVFAPTDDAFAEVDPDALDALLADKEALAALLTYHVLAGKVPSSALQPTQTVTSLNGEDFTINVGSGGSDDRRRCGQHDRHRHHRHPGEERRDPRDRRRDDASDELIRSCGPVQPPGPQRRPLRRWPTTRPGLQPWNQITGSGCRKSPTVSACTT